MAFLKKAGGAIKRAVTGEKAPRVREAFDRMKQDAGFIPIFNIDDLEARRVEIKRILADIETKVFDPDEVGHHVKREVVQKTFKLFFSEGDPWYRGLDNRELAQKVNDFLANCMEVGYLEPFTPDLFEEAMVLLHLSFQALDVTNTPPYIIESRPIIGTGGGRHQVEGEIDMAGVMALRQDLEEQAQEMERLRAQVDKYKK